MQRRASGGVNQALQKYFPDCTANAINCQRKPPQYKEIYSAKVNETGNTYRETLIVSPVPVGEKPYWQQGAPTKCNQELPGQEIETPNFGIVHTPMT